MENSSVSSALSSGVPDGSERLIPDVVKQLLRNTVMSKNTVTRSQKLIYYLTCIVYLEFYEPIVQISVKTQLD